MAFAEKTGVTKRSVLKMVVSEPGNMVEAANGRNSEVVVCCVSKPVAMCEVRGRKKNTEGVSRHSRGGHNGCQSVSQLAAKGLYSYAK